MGLISLLSLWLWCFSLFHTSPPPSPALWANTVLVLSYIKAGIVDVPSQSVWNCLQRLDFHIHSLLPQMSGLNQFGFLKFFFMRSIVFGLQKKCMSIVVHNWFSRAFILNLHSQADSSGNLGDAGGATLLECKYTLHSLSPVKGLPGKQLSAAWTTFLAVQTSFPIAGFCLFLSNMLLAITAVIKRPSLTWKYRVLLLICFKLFIWTVHMWFEGLTHLCKIQWFICVLALLEALFGFWVGKVMNPSIKLVKAGRIRLLTKPNDYCILHIFWYLFSFFLKSLISMHLTDNVIESHNFQGKKDNIYVTSNACHTHL